MGLKCSINKETCEGFSCTEFDGKIKNGKNAWDEIRKVVDEIPCQTCKEDGLKRVSALQDVVNLGIGERTKPFNPKNLKEFVDDVNCVYNTCKERGDCI